MKTKILYACLGSFITILALVIIAWTGLNFNTKNYRIPDRILLVSQDFDDGYFISSQLWGKDHGEKLSDFLYVESSGEVMNWKVPFSNTVSLTLEVDKDGEFFLQGIGGYVHLQKDERVVFADKSKVNITKRIRFTQFPNIEVSE